MWMNVKGWMCVSLVYTETRVETQIDFSRLWSHLCVWGFEISFVAVD
jgi:hypothetical protein